MSDSPRLFVAGLVIAMAVGIWPSCGGTTSSDTGEARGTAADVDAMCRAVCDHNLMCRGSVDAGCVERCLAKAGPPSLLSRAALSIFEQCMRDPACLRDDDCEARVLARNPDLEKEIAACNAFLRTCPSIVEGGLCLRVGTLVAEVRAQWKACYSGACPDTGKFLDCLEAASAP